MNWKETFYTGKREHPQEKKPASLTALLMPSLLGTAICLVCLCSLTWAWFTATQNSGVQPIQSATATVTASSLDGDPITLSNTEQEMKRATGQIGFEMIGNARKAYVLIRVGDKTYYTDYLTTDGYTVKFDGIGTTTVYLTLCWGDYPDKDVPVVENNGTIAMPVTEEPVNTEQPVAGGNDQQIPDATVPANGENTGSDDANTGDQASNGENTGSENGGSTGNGSGEQGSDSGTGSDTGAGGSTGGDAGTGDTSNGTDGATDE